MEQFGFHPSPSKPRFVPPPRAVDAHCHVFGPAAVFPFAPQRKYTPADASKEQLFALGRHLGFERHVIVQASCHGEDNRALLDALAFAGESARGVVSLPPEVAVDEIRSLHQCGVRGVRFNFLKRLVDFTSPQHLQAMAKKIAPFGWHLVVYCEAADLAELVPVLTALPVPVVLDHMARPDVAAGLDSPNFQLLLNVLEQHQHLWTKLSCPERLSLSGPPHYSDVVPFAREVLKRCPERVLWGTDWPHPNMTTHSPDDGHLVDVIPHIAPTAQLQQLLLVGNPDKLYWHQP